ncbi:unnamed protein product, partial [Amoebophrya sp. A25]|eukprot:GSA25T00015467001.1
MTDMEQLQQLLQGAVLGGDRGNGVNLYAFPMEDEWGNYGTPVLQATLWAASQVFSGKFPCEDLQRCPFLPPGQEEDPSTSTSKPRCSAWACARTWSYILNGVRLIFRGQG